MRNKRVIRLTESEFNGLVSEMVSRAVNKTMINEGFQPIVKGGNEYDTQFFLGLAQEGYKYANQFLRQISQRQLSAIKYVAKVLENENYNEIPEALKQIDKAIEMLHSFYKHYGNSAKYHLAPTDLNLKDIKTFLQQQMRGAQQQMNPQQQMGAQQGNM